MTLSPAVPTLLVVSSARRVRAGASWRPTLAATCLLLVVTLAACGDTGNGGTTNTQGGTNRAPGAPPPGAQQTLRPTATTAR